MISAWWLLVAFGAGVVIGPVILVLILRWLIGPGHVQIDLLKSR